jgi:hypothetical protein
MAAKPKTIEEYLAALSDDKRGVLEKLRKTIRDAAPKAEEARAPSAFKRTSPCLFPWRGNW